MCVCAEKRGSNGQKAGQEQSFFLLIYKTLNCKFCHILLLLLFFHNFGIVTTLVETYDEMDNPTCNTPTQNVMISFSVTAVRRFWRICLVTG